jgi:RNA polymerase sigma-70 factor (ECF subfamily)
MQDQLAERFESDRAHLRSVAYRMLGSAAEADDAVQEAWLRLSRSDTSDVDNLTGWLTTVVARVCLNMLKARGRREEPVESLPESVAPDGGPEEETVLADSVGMALLVVLDNLTPAERLAFVLHDMFGVPFDEIAPIIDRTPVTTRQLASRARRRVRGGGGAERAGADGAGTDGAGTEDTGRRQEVVRAFLAASRDGDFEALVALLDPAAVARSPEGVAEGARAVAGMFAGRAQAARPALLDGIPGLVWAKAGTIRVAFRFTFAGERVAAIDLVADPDELARMDIDFV